jgi:hypothetical protein
MYSSVRGYQAKSTLAGGSSLAGGQITQRGDAQSTELQMSGQTTDATPTSLHTAQGTGSLTLVMPDNSHWAGLCIVTAERVDVIGERAEYVLDFSVKRDTGAASTGFGPGGASTKIITRESDTTWDAIVTFSTSSGGIRVNVTGALNKVINWTARFIMNQLFL